MKRALGKERGVDGGEGSQVPNCSVSLQRTIIAGKHYVKVRSVLSTIVSLITQSVEIMLVGVIGETYRTE